jgi:large subunit ribosomal protein L21
MSAGYAIVESGGKQYRVEKGSTILVDRLRAGEGETVQLRAVAFLDGEKLAASADELAKVKVEAVVAAEPRGPKLRVFKYKAKKGYRRRAGHRSELTQLEVTSVGMAGRKPAEKKEPAEKKAVEAEPAEKKKSKPAAKKAEAKPAAKKPATKKGSTAAKKPAASKAKTEAKE